MSMLLRSRTIPNDWARSITAYCFLIAPTLVLSGSQCDRRVVDAVGDGGQTGDQANDHGASLRTLRDNWVLECTAASGSVWGHTYQSSLSASEDELTLFILLDDGSTPSVSFRRSPDGALTGYWEKSLDEPVPPPGTTNWAGNNSVDQRTLTGVWTSSSGEVPMTFHRAVRHDPTCIGTWTRRGDNAAGVLTSFDNQTFSLRVPGAAGMEVYNGLTMGADVRYDCYAAVGLSSFSPYTALFFADRTRLHLRVLTDTGARGMILDRDTQQSSLNGRWVGGVQNSQDFPAKRSVRVVVENKGTLFIDDLVDGGARGLFSYVAGLSGSGYTDTRESGWSAHVSFDQQRIVGQRIYNQWYDSADRTARPAADELTGDWSSTYVNWQANPPFTVYGKASIVQNGDRLQIMDTGTSGVTYRLEADWVGDHYEGNFWDVTTPDAPSTWRGELLADRSLLHGTWAKGEYSFSLFPNLSPDQVPTSASTYVVDPYSDLAATVRDQPSGSGATAYRQQDKITSLVLALPEGAVEITVDDWMRPVRIMGLGAIINVAWAADAQSITATITDTATGQTEVSPPLALNLTDAGVLSLIGDAQTQTGRDLSNLAKWVQTNPGYLLSRMQGGRPASKALAANKLAAKAPKLVYNSQPARDLFSDAASAATAAGAIGVALIAAVQAKVITGGAVVLATSLGKGALILAGGFGVAALAILVGSVLIMNLFIALSGNCCDPCGLWCLTCCPPKKN